MKRIALAVLLALCGARVYGQVAPVEQQPQDVTQAQVDELQRVLNDTKSIDAIADQLGLPKEEVKGWFSSHKTAVISSIVGLAGLYATGCGLGKWAKGTLTQEGKFPEGTWKTREFCAKLACMYVPLVWMKDKAVAGKDWSNEHRLKAAGITLAVILVGALIYELAHKDSVLWHLIKKASGKKAVAEVQAVVEDAKEEDKKGETTPVVPATV